MERTLITTEERGVLAIFQPGAVVASTCTQRGRQDMRNTRATRGDRENVDLRDRGSWEEREYFRFRVDKVDLAHQSVGGVLGGEAEAPSEPDYKMLWQICGKSQDMRSFTLPELRKYLLEYPIEERPHCLQQLNAWQSKKLRLLFQQMNPAGGDNVTQEQFLAWWEQYVVVHVDPDIQEISSGVVVKVTTVPAAPTPAAALVRPVVGVEVVRASTAEELSAYPSISAHVPLSAVVTEAEVEAET